MWEIDVTGQVGALAIEAKVTAGPGPLLLVGPNGSGKTTLLLMLLGVRPPEAGRIALGGRTLYDGKRGICLPPEQRRIGYVPQSYALFPHMSVLENVMFGLNHSADGVSKAQRREMAHALLAALDVGRLADRRVGGLSGGERQRVALARALLPQPLALLLDEPLAALDATARQATRAFLAETLARLALPAIVTTHDPEDARALGGRVVVLESGRVVQEGAIDELQREPATAFVRAFVGGEGADGR